MLQYTMPVDIITKNAAKIAISLGIVAATIATRFVVKNVLKVFFAKVTRQLDKRRLAKTKTARSLFLNLVNSLILGIALLMILSQWGVNIGPILAGLGVIGVGLSFGSQSLVKDFISGFFILFEDVFGVGDHVKIGTYEGKVVKMTIRSTVLRDNAGNRTYIPNSKIDIVTRLKPKTKR